MKPTYGGVSRYGLVALANSLDQAGPVTRTVLDAALLHEVIGGHDPLRLHLASTSRCPTLVAAARQGADGDLTGVRIGVVKELGGEGYQAGVLARFHEAVDLLVEAGAEVVEVSCPHFVHALAAYYLILPAEASSATSPSSTRCATACGCCPTASTPERRGGHAGHPRGRLRRRGQAPHHPRHLRAVQRLLRRLLRPGAEGAHADHPRLRRPRSSRPTCWSRPTAPTTAFKLGEKLDDPLAMYLNDLATIPANLAGVPGISVPSGLADEDGLPVGFQILAPALADDRVYRVGAALEALLARRSGAARCSTRPLPLDEGAA